MSSILLRSTTALLLVAVLALQSTAVSLANTSPEFSGQATALRATALGTTFKFADTGPLPSSGGSQQASLLTAGVPGVAKAEVLHATTIGQNDSSQSEASVATLTITAGGNTVSADFLMSRASATCGSDGATTSGSSEIVGLTINGQSVKVSGSPNQTITLPAGAGEVIINQQTTSPGSITVNALHVTVTGVADVVVSSAHADISHCPPQPAQGGVCNGGDFVTGGGWIEPSGSRDTFAVGGGIKNGGLWGHLEYHDRSASGPAVHGTGVTMYKVTGPTSRHIEGTAEVNGQSGFTYAVDVADNGEPGRSDVFAIKLSNGYSAGPSSLAGGNIQLHDPCD
jgi:hypothetical protein